MRINLEVQFDNMGAVIDWMEIMSREVGTEIVMDWMQVMYMEIMDSRRLKINLKMILQRMGMR